jgi:methyl-accepting chemotaxis protein
MLTKISHRLIALIVTAIVGLVLMGGNGVWQLQRINTSLHEISGNALPSIIVLGEAHTHFLETRVALLNHVIETDIAKLPELEKQVRDSLKATQDSLTKYEPLVSDDDDKQQLAADRAAVEVYAKLLNEALFNSSNNEKAFAVELIRSKLRPAGQNALDAFEKHMKDNVEWSQQQEKAADVIFANARLLSLFIAVGAAALLVWVAAMTYRSVVGKALRARDDVTRVVDTLDFSRPLQADGNDELSQLLQALNRLISRLRDELSAIRNSTERITQSSNDLAGASQQVQTSSSTQADAAASMAASIEQLTVSVNHVADRTGEASRIARQSGEQAVDGRDAVARTAERIGAISALVDNAAAELGRLEDSGRQIDSVVSVIKDVADQTNLLALNAAIEAARAGEQGRGFAVVADEVRKLAERTSSSTTEIAAMVASIQQRSGEVARLMRDAVSSVRDGVSQADTTRGAIDQIAAGAAHSGSLVAEIATALSEQSSASTTIASQVERVAQMAEENSQAAGHSAGLADELKGLAEDMKQTVSAYRLG